MVRHQHMSRHVVVVTVHASSRGDFGDMRVIARVMLHGDSDNWDRMSKVKVDPPLCFIYFQKYSSLTHLFSLHKQEKYWNSN